MKRWLGNISLWSTTTWELTGVPSLGLGSRLRTDETEMSPPCKTQPSPVSICFKVLFQDAKLNLSFIHPSFHEQYYVHQIDAHQNFLKASSVHLDSWKLQGERSLTSATRPRRLPSRINMMPMTCWSDWRRTRAMLVNERMRGQWFPIEFLEKLKLFKFAENQEILLDDECMLE